MVNDPAVNRAPVEIYGVTETHAPITFLCYEGDPASSHIQYWTPPNQTAQYVAHVYLTADDLRRHGDRLVSAAGCSLSVTYELAKDPPKDMTKESLHAFRVEYGRRY
ncbi:hypothetical protein D3867_23750 (plasmid) [Azospirillum argentinense]|uniref:Uncharacterized protein n=2 Tax=Azospirillum TaxID=191 RepID=A0A4D8Q3K8_AZOBR|nr:hypothetical protein D3867_23750 [Azospirillum argentinense]